MSVNSSALLIHGGSLGDFVLALSIAQAMTLGGVERIEVLARGPHRPLAARGGVDSFRDLDAAPWHLLFSDSPIPDGLKAELKGFEAAVDLFGGPAIARRLREAGISRVFSIDPQPRPETRSHITEQWRCDLRNAGLELPVLGPLQIEVTDAERETARQELGLAFGGKVESIVLIHPGSGSSAKCWPLDDFLRLGRSLSEQHAGVVFCIGEAELERWPAETLAKLSRNGALLRHLPLEKLAASIAACDLYIGNDSGVTHLAAAVGTPTVAIFGPTSALLWGPLGRFVEVAANADRSWPSFESVLSAARAFLKFPDNIESR